MLQSRRTDHRIPQQNLIDRLPFPTPTSVNYSCAPPIWAQPAIRIHLPNWRSWAVGNSRTSRAGGQDSDTLRSKSNGARFHFIKKYKRRAGPPPAGPTCRPLNNSSSFVPPSLSAIALVSSPFPSPHRRHRAQISCARRSLASLRRAGEVLAAAPPEPCPAAADGRGGCSA
jgi:hypothetical protein